MRRVLEAATGHRRQALVRWWMVAVSGLSAGVAPAWAHGGEEITAQSAWSAWRFTPEIVIPTVLVAAIYCAGVWRRRASRAQTPWWRHALFAAGLAAIYLALQSPMDPIAGRLFSMHQAQHLLLRMIGPMLLALSWPRRRLTAGLPESARRNLLAPVISSAAFRRFSGVLTQPVVATALFILALYAWEVPRWHDLALRNTAVHDTMHLTMLLAGLVFFWRVFDRRAPRSLLDLDDAEEVPWWRLFSWRGSPYGLGYGTRLMMLWMSILAGILLGAYTTLKTTVLYTAYDTPFRLYRMPPLADEELGGIIIWVAGSLMCLMAILIVLHLWGVNETRMDRRLARSSSNAAALRYPTTGAELIARARPMNQAMAAGIGALVATVFATAMMLAVLHAPPAPLAGATAARTGWVRHAGHLPPHRALR